MPDGAAVDTGEHRKGSVDGDGWALVPAREDRLKRSSMQLLRDPLIGAYFVGKLSASIGIWIHNVVAAIVVFQLTKSALLVGLVSVFQFSPQILLAAWFGTLADRRDPRRQAIYGRIIVALGSGGLAMSLAVAGADGLKTSVVFAAAAVVGLGFAMGAPALHALVPLLVGRREVAAVVAVDTAPLTIARALGPALGALLLGTIGAAGAFAVAAVAQLVLAGIISRFKFAERVPDPDIDGRMRAGLRHLRTDPVVAVLLLGVAAVGLGVDPVITLTPPIASSLGGGPSLVATLASAYGIGAASAPIVLGYVRRRRSESWVASLGLCLIILGHLSLSVSVNSAAAVASLYVGGVGMMLGITGFTTQLQQRLPDHLRGRVMGLWAVCFIGSRPLAAAMNGALADATSASVALLVLSGLLLVIARYTRPSRVLRPPPRPHA